MTTNKTKLENLDWQIKNPLKEIPCPLCQSHDYKFLIKEHNLDLVRCKYCSHVFVNPIPSEQELKDFYDQYFPEESKELWLTQMDNIFRKEGLEYIKKHRENGDILDVGCGLGYFPALMKEAGFNAEGLEISENACSFAREKFGLYIYEDLLEKIDFGDKKYDTITMFYVLEHVTNPFDLLEIAYDLLRKNGILIIRIPNANIRADKIFSRLGSLGKKFLLINPPRHLQDYNPKSIRKVLEKVGYQNIKIANAIPRKTGSLLQLARRYATFYYSQFLYYLSFGKIVNGSSMTIYARKEAE